MGNIYMTLFFERCYMKNTAIVAISVLMILLQAAACSANMDNTGLQGRNDNAGIGLTYDRGREDYPGQSYANMNRSTDLQDRRAAGDGGTVDNNTGGITGTQLSAGDRSSGGEGIVLSSIKTPVKKGDTGSLSFRGKADTQYTITGVYRNSNDVMTSTVVRQSDADGFVDLSWNVAEDTVPGTYGIMITGGGEQLTVSYTVTE